MADYQLNISHNNNYNEIDLNGAIDILNNYAKHRIGQPIAIAYTDDNGERKLLLAIGKRNYVDSIDGRSYGPEFYEIINDDDNDQERLEWEILTD